MAPGKITKLIHLTLQSSVAVEAGVTAKGYGYLEADGRRLYFPADAVESYTFDDLQVGQEVDFEADPKLPLAKKVTPVGAIQAPPPPRITAP